MRVSRPTQVRRERHLQRSPSQKWTWHASFTEPVLIKKLRAKTIEKFIAYELPLAVAQARYGGHFQRVMQVSCANSS